MGTIRPETYYAGERLMQLLDARQTINEMIHDGGDIILFTIPTGEKVSIHMIESGIPVYEIRKILTENNQQGIYTLFMLWCSMMVPNDGKLYKMDDWMEAFIALSVLPPEDATTGVPAKITPDMIDNGRVYAYDIYDGVPYLFSVYFRHEKGDIYRVEYGTTLRTGTIALKTITTDLDGLQDTWRIAYFGAPKYDAESVMRGTVPLSGLEASYALLGVEASDDADTIKQAYRLLARKYHPDRNPDEKANEQMQKLNEAYKKIMDARD